MVPQQEVNGSHSRKCMGHTAGSVWVSQQAVYVSHSRDCTCPTAGSICVPQQGAAGFGPQSGAGSGTHISKGLGPTARARVNIPAGSYYCLGCRGRRVATDRTGLTPDVCDT